MTRAATIEPARAAGRSDTTGISRPATDVQRLVDDGFRLFLAGNTQSAAATFRRALDLDPHSAELHHNLASALAAHDRLSEAVEHFRRSLALRPNSADTLRNYALALSRCRR